MKLIRTSVALAMLLACAVTASAQDAIVYVVRHAERSDAATQTPNKTMMGSDPPLSKAGEARAQRLASVLRSAGIKHIFTTEFQRTRQTAAPLAAALHVKPVMAPAKDVDGLVEAVKTLKDPALVVAHGNTVPEILQKLGVRDAVTLGEQDYDNLFIVVRHGGSAPAFITLHYQ